MYGFSDPRYRPYINLDIVGNKVVIRACIMGSEIPQLYTLSFGHYASSAWFIMRYMCIRIIILVLSLFLFMKSPLLRYAIFHLLVSYMYMYIKKNELPRVGPEPTTLHSR